MLPRLAGVPRASEARDAMLLILTAWYFRWASGAPVGRLHLRGWYVAFNRRPWIPAFGEDDELSSAMDPRLRRG